jgi:uncharacterized protein
MKFFRKKTKKIMKVVTAAIIISDQKVLLTRRGPAEKLFGYWEFPGGTDIIEELKKPGCDPRSEFQTASFRDDIREIKDLKEGMVLQGVVTNVTAFGAFVDIGVHQDGLVHISHLANRYVKDPNDAAKAGQVVKVKVLSADAQRKRISLSIKEAEKDENIRSQIR